MYACMHALLKNQSQRVTVSHTNAGLVLCHNPARALQPRAASLLTSAVCQKAARSPLALLPELIQMHAPCCIHAYATHVAGGMVVYACHGCLCYACPCRYFKGTGGVSVDPVKAIEFWTKAASQDNAEAQCNLGERPPCPSA